MYHPSSTERKLKARFWTVWNDGITKGTPTIEDYFRITGDKESKASDGGFVAWVLNAKEAAEMLHYLGHLNLQLAEEMLVDEDVKTGDKIKVMSLVNDLIKSTAPKAQKEFADKQLADMTPEQLKAFIAKLLPSGVPSE